MAEPFQIGPETTFGEFVKHKAETVGDKVFLTYVRDFDRGLDEQFSYRDMHLQSNRLANGLRRLGLSKGDGISLVEINSPEFLFTLFAAAKLGTYTVLVNTGLKGDSLQYIIDHSDSKAAILHWTLVDRYEAIREQLPKLEHVIVDESEAPAGYELPKGALSLQEVMQAPADDVETKLDPKGMAILIYTSGTTGLPKATTFLYERVFLGLALHAPTFLAHAMGRAGDVFYTCLPLFHGNALQLTCLPGFAAEFPVVLSKRFSASRFWDIIRKYGVTNFNLLGSMPHFLMKQPEKPNDRDNKVWRVNSAACPKELVRAFEERFGVKVYEAYGAVDGGGFMLGSFGYEDIPVGTMGRPPEGTIAGIMDDDGNLLGCNETGELVFLVKEEERQQRQVVYYKDEAASKSRIQEASDGRLWFHTGDLAQKDLDGWFYFVDRKKDAIRRRGENIAAWSIERVVNQHDKVLESAAYGVKSAEYGEDEVMVAVVLKPGESMTPEELLDFCRDKMADFMLPRFIDFIEKLPKSEVHRIMKRFLKDRGVTQSTYDREKAGYQIRRSSGQSPVRRNQDTDMSDTFTPRQAIEFAVKTEELGAKFYTKLAGRFSRDAELKELFESLAKDEAAHEAQFRRLVEETPPDEGVSTGPEFDYLRAMSLSQFFMGKKGLKKKYKKIKGKGEAMRIVFELEKATLQYYQALKEALGENDALQEIIATEKAHVMKAMQYVITEAKFRGLADKW